jgi:hypothetical protein
MTQTIPIDVTVSHNGRKFDFEMSGPGVTKPDELRVTGRSAVDLEFRAVAGRGVRDVEFLDDAKKSILVGRCDDPTCPPEVAGDEFDEGRHGPNRQTLVVKDRKTKDGQYRFQLTFLATPEKGEPRVEPWDPVIINQ